MGRKTVERIENQFGKINQELLRQYWAGELTSEELFNQVSAGRGHHPKCHMSGQPEGKLRNKNRRLKHRSGGDPGLRKMYVGLINTGSSRK